MTKINFDEMTVYEAAMYYKSKGYYPIPIDADGKKPVSGLKFQDTGMPTDEQLEEWFANNPERNIALRTYDTIVIDIDRHCDVNGDTIDGLESFKELYDEPWWVDTLTATTGGDGIHHVFMKPKDSDYLQNIGALPGVDVKAHINNYHLVAPSAKKKFMNPFDVDFDPDNPVVKSKGYHWTNWDTYHTVVRIPEIPKQLIKALNMRQRDEQKTSNTSHISKSSSFQPYVESGRGKATKQMMETVVDGFGGQGTRNNNLVRFVGQMFAAGVDPEKAYTLAMMANDNTDNRIEQSEFDASFQSILKNHFNL